MSHPAAAPIVEVLDGGLLTTIQDAGRPRAVVFGVPEGGACDRWSFAQANLRCGNPRDAAVLEITLVPPRMRVVRGTVMALAGADLGLRVRGPSGDRAFRPGTVIAVGPGDELGPDGGATTGCRAYLAIAGGLAVEPVLGSASTALGAGFGGVDGRPVRAGDVLAAWGATGDETRDLGSVAAIPTDDELAAPGTGSAIGLLDGPSAADLDPAILDSLLAGSWRVGSASDRMGIRLEGPPIQPAPARAVASHGVTWGTVQLPPDGLPIVLLADHQPTGGYPVPAVVPIADHPRLAQLRPGDPVRFAPVTIEDAVLALRRQRVALDAVERACRDARSWDDAWRFASG